MLTQTKPWPPPGAGEVLAVSVLAPRAAAGVAAAAAVEVLGLNKSPRLKLPGDDEAAGLAAVAAAAFLALPFPFGEAAGDAATAAGDVVALAFVAARCFAGVGD